MMPYLKKEFGNGSSLHSFGQKAKAVIENARVKVAEFLHCQPLEVVFTSGATEANNLAIRGVLRNLVSQKETKFLIGKPHIITTQIEHESVLSPCEELEAQGLAEVTYVPVNSEGLVQTEDIKKAIKENTVLVSVMYANSEIGTIQPIAEIGAMLKKLKIENSKLKILFHTDAVQAAQFLDCNVQKLGVDLLTLSSHKIYGPKGAGVSYIKEGVGIDPLILGGGQEQGIRSGTENVVAIVGMGKAIEEIGNPKAAVTNIKIRQLRDVLIKEVLRKIPGSSLTGSKTKRLTNNVHFLFEGIEGRELAMMLDQKGIAASTGSACSEKTQEPSHVLLALGISEERAYQSLRITIGKYTTKEEIAKTIKYLALIVAKLTAKKV